MAPRIGVSEVSDAIGAPFVASVAAEYTTSCRITPYRDLAADCSMSFVRCDVTNESTVHETRRAIAASGRIVRGNAPNLGGSHEKRNVDQRLPARREPDWRC